MNAIVLTDLIECQTDRSRKQFSFELPLSQLPTADMRKVLQLWTAWRGSRPAPTWRDVKLPYLPPKLLPLASVVDVIDGGTDYNYRFWGSGLTDIFGQDETNQKFSAYHVPFKRQVRAIEYTEILTRRAPMLTVTSMERYERVVAQRTNLRLPVMDNPKEVTKILSISIMSEVNMSGQTNLAAFWQDGEEWT